jgi:hypothetical protein
MRKLEIVVRVIGLYFVGIQIVWPVQRRDRGERLKPLAIVHRFRMTPATVQSGSHRTAMRSGELHGLTHGALPSHTVPWSIGRLDIWTFACSGEVVTCRRDRVERGHVRTVDRTVPRGVIARTASDDERSKVETIPSSSSQTVDGTIETTNARSLGNSI